MTSTIITDENGWVVEYDSAGREISRTYAGDPEHANSWVAAYDSAGRMVSRTYAADQRHQRSWAAEYDSAGRMVSLTYAGDPKHVKSWGSGAMTEKQDLKARAKAKTALWERVQSASIVGLACASFGSVAVPLALGVEVNVVVTILASVALLAFSYELGVRPVEKPKRRKSLAQLETEREIERCEWEAALSADSNQPDRVAFYRSRADGQRRILDEMKRSAR